MRLNNTTIKSVPHSANRREVFHRECVTDLRYRDELHHEGISFFYIKFLVLDNG